jgi:hypothetical protein
MGVMLVIDSCDRTDCDLESVLSGTHTHRNKQANTHTPGLIYQFDKLTHIDLSVD